jgi:hypothetical protein
MLRLARKYFLFSLLLGTALLLIVGCSSVCLL